MSPTSNMFTVNAVINSVKPSSGSKSGCTSVVIEGSG